MISVKDKMTSMGFGLQQLFVKPVLVILCLFAGMQLFAQNIPARPDPPRLVNDFAGIMSGEDINTLERKLDRYNDTTSTQIAIVTVETLDGADVGSYAAELGEKWGVGTKANHNGVVILLAKKEHKVTIRTGYGVEEKLGSIICDRIIQNRLVPNFKAGDYYKGFDEATDEMMQRLSGTYKGNGHGAPEKGIPFWVIVIIVLFLLFIVPLFFRGGGGNDTFGGGGILGAGLGGFIGGGGFGGGDNGGGGFGGFGGGGFSGGGSSGSW